MSLLKSAIRSIRGYRGEGSPDGALLSAIAAVKYCPVFILGNHRSGTTILYKLLGQTGLFNIVTLYHTLRYDFLIANHLQSNSDRARAQLNQELISRGIHNRIIDDMQVNADYPDEYCFVLVTKKRSFRITPRTWRLFDEFCRKIQFISDPDRPLLLKNPFDYNNFPLIRRLMPDAKFVFIHRHPVNVINSALNAVRTSWHEGNPLNQLRSAAYATLQHNQLISGFFRWITSPNSRFEPARRLITRRLLKYETAFIRNIELLTSDAFISVRYEDLISEPNKIVSLILDFLKMETDVQFDFQPYIQPRPLRLLPEVQKEEDRLNRSFHEVLAYHGYLDGCP